VMFNVAGEDLDAGEFFVLYVLCDVVGEDLGAMDFRCCIV
jgi:hypothetical protein